MTLHQKYQNLKTVFENMSGVAVAFSGGVDSTLVLAVAHSVLGVKVLAVTGRSDSLAEREYEAARSLSRQLGIEHREVATREMDSPQYTQNPINRCFYCKFELYTHLKELPEVRRGWAIANGTNADDLGDYRPGLEAAEQAGVVSPLVEAGFTKQDVRDLAQHLNLPNWDKPAMPCLSSRIPYGQEVTPEKLRRIEQAEKVLVDMGFRQVRVRHKNSRACIEVPREDLPRLRDPECRDRIEARLLEMGFATVEVDPRGFRSGSLNEALPPSHRGD